MADHELSIPQQENVFEILDLADEEQIIAEISGRVTDKYVYSFKQDGKDVTGLSYAGTNWAVREYAKQGEAIRITHKEMMVDPTNPEYVIVVVTAQRFVVNPETNRETPLDSTLGVKRQWTKKKRRRYDDRGNTIGEETIEDPHFWEKAASKAIRNGKQALIPTDMVKKLISEALKTKNVGTIRENDPKSQKPAQSRPAQKSQAPAPAAPPPQEEAAPPKTAPAVTAPQPPPATVAKPASSPPRPPQEPAPAKSSKDALIQRFEVVLKKAFNTTDPILARQFLKAISGTDRIGEFSEDDLNKYGKILQGITRGQYKISEDKTFITEVSNGNVVWGTQPAPTQPAPQPPPAASAEGENFF